MKLLICCLLLGAPLFGEHPSAATESTCIAREPEQFSLGIALGAIVVLGIVVGVVVSNASN